MRHKANTKAVCHRFVELGGWRRIGAISLGGSITTGTGPCSRVLVRRGAQRVPHRPLRLEDSPPRTSPVGNGGGSMRGFEESLQDSGGLAAVRRADGRIFAAGARKTRCARVRGCVAVGRGIAAAGSGASAGGSGASAEVSGSSAGERSRATLVPGSAAGGSGSSPGEQSRASLVLGRPAGGSGSSAGEQSRATLVLGRPAGVSGSSAGEQSRATLVLGWPAGVSGSSAGEQSRASLDSGWPAGRLRWVNRPSFGASERPALG